MTARIFDNRPSQEWIGFTVLRRVIVAAAIVHFSLAAAPPEVRELAVQLK